MTPRRASSVAKQIGLGRFGEAPHAAPQIDLPARAGQHLIVVGGVGTACRNRRVLRQALASRIALVVDLRVERASASG